MRYKAKDIGDAGLDVRVPVTREFLDAECPDLDAQPTAMGLALTGQLTRTGSDYLLRGKLAGSLNVTCARCLERAELPIDVPIAVTYVEKDEDAAADGDDELEGGDVLTFDGEQIDLGPELRDEILLAMPIGVVCRPDCAGLCSVCGGNKNAKPCDCEELQRQHAGKFGALKDLKI